MALLAPGTKRNSPPTFRMPYTVRRTEYGVHKTDFPISHPADPASQLPKPTLQHTSLLRSAHAYPPACYLLFHYPSFVLLDSRLICSHLTRLFSASGLHRAPALPILAHMPLRQALLNFYRGRVDNAKSATSMLPENRPALRRSASSSSSDSDRDTIVVAPAPCPQLPTPSESSFDVSVQDARVVTLKQVPKGRARRVSRRLTTSASHGGLVETMEHETISTRTVSGETLVNMDNTSQSTLVREGVAALDLPWNMSEVFAKEGKEAILGGRKDHMSAHMESSPGAQEDDEELRIRQAKAEAKKAKMAENNKLWEKRRKIAEKHATRRSSRVPVLDKAGQIMTSIANSVLGKRKERVEEGRDSKRSKSMGGADILPEEPSSKKRRVSQGDAPLSDEPVQQKSPLKRREKRWLSSGLYSGQPRVFDDGKNKRKSSVNFDVFKENRVLPLPMYAGERLLKQGRDFKLPFDVFSPLPAGQPKPDEWRKVNKNVFVGDAAQSWRVSKYEEHSSCMCKPETGCDQNCMNRYMYYECDERNCNLSPEQCGNRNFEGLRHRVKKGGKYNVGVEVIKTEDRGYGVRSNRTFEPHQIIVEYTGEIITQEECEHRMRTMYKNNEVSSHGSHPRI